MPTDSTTPSPFPRGVIIGGEIGGAILILSIGAVIFLCRRRKLLK